MAECIGFSPRNPLACCDAGRGRWPCSTFQRDLREGPHTVQLNEDRSAYDDEISPAQDRDKLR
jgi:hypothetical protein